MLLFKDFQVCTQNHGFISPWINPTRGVHQGCCISPHIFVVCGQVFAHLFEQNQNIKGLVIHEIYNLLLQFADDTTFLLEATEQAISATTSTLEIAQLNLGLKVNYDKTNLYRIGSLQNTAAICYMQRSYNWKDPPVENLGIFITTDLLEMARQNLLPLRDKVRARLGFWEHRSLTLMGKVLVVNTLIESLFMYRLSAFSVIDHQIIEGIQDDILSFIWSGKKAKINF